MSSVTSSKTCGSYGILTVCTSPAAFAIGLDPTNPSMITIAKETLVLRRPSFSPGLRLLVPTFSLPNAPPSLPLRLHCRLECSPTTARTSLHDANILTCTNDTNKIQNAFHSFHSHEFVNSYRIVRHERSSVSVLRFSPDYLRRGISR